MKLTPGLVFIEKPADPTLGRILTKLVPKLKTIGYDCFFDTTPHSATLQEQIEQIEKNEKIYDELERQFKGFNLDIQNKQDLEKFVLLTLMNMGIALVKYSASDFLVNIGHLIDQHSAQESYKNFYQTLIKQNIHYQGIDVNNSNRVVSLAMLYAYGKFREESMANAYLGTTEAIFGKMTLAQAQNMQRDLMIRLSAEEACARFCFFNIDTGSASINQDGLLQQVPAALQSMVVIDAYNKNDDEVVKAVISQILKKQIQLNEFIVKQALAEEVKQIDFEHFKNAYFNKYNNTPFLFKNPLSTMKQSLQNGTVNSMEDVVQYVEKYPSTRTADVIREFKKI